MTSKKSGITPLFLVSLELTVVTTATVVIVTAAYEEDDEDNNPFAAAIVAKIKTAHESFASFLPSLIFYEKEREVLQIMNKLKIIQKSIDFF